MVPLRVTKRERFTLAAALFLGVLAGMINLLAERPRKTLGDTTSPHATQALQEQGRPETENLSAVEVGQGLLMK